MLQLPIKSINVTVDVMSLINLDEDKTENPFLMREQIKFLFFFILRITKNYFRPSIIELALGKIEEITSERSLRVFDIKSGDSVFAAITMFKSFYKLGDEICGQINFLQNYNDISSISCLQVFKHLHFLININKLQVLIRVETMEVNLYGSKREENIVHHSSEHLVTAFIRETHFRVPIPLTYVPAFSTKAGSIFKISIKLNFF